ncbi:hypothetical protein DPMN_065576 [Dreissena polymorpha]|uniref:Uncharacterized protein n=1 Tax=Dreissena polymorpha TaxID=45954 RepID=A0A9D3YW82_DREPO|nr:hypothetical protein DPMN_065576 [Dreissena polymorpha]
MKPERWRTTVTTKKIQVFINTCLRKCSRSVGRTRFLTKNYWQKSNSPLKNASFRVINDGKDTPFAIMHPIQKRKYLIRNPLGNRKTGRSLKTWHRDLVADTTQVRKRGGSWRDSPSTETPGDS